MIDGKNEIDSLSEKIKKTLEEIVNTTNPFKLFFIIGTAWRDISSAIEESVILFSDKLISGKNSGMKEALLYSLHGGKIGISSALKNDKTLLKESTWEKIKLKKGVLSVYPNYQNLPLFEKQVAVLAYYGEHDKTSKIDHLLLKGGIFDLVEKYKKQIIENCGISQEKVILEILNYGNFLKHDRTLAMQKDPLKYEYYGRLGIDKNETQDAKYFIENSSDILNSYVADFQEKKIQEEIAIIRNGFDSKFLEAEKNSIFYEKLSLLKSSIVQISQSFLSPIFIPYLIKKIAKNIGKEAIGDLKVSEFALGRHFANNYEEYYIIKRFYTTLNREIKNPGFNGWSILLLSVIFLILSPIFFLISFIIFLGYQFMTHTHEYRKFTLQNGSNLITIPLLLIFSFGTVFFFSYTKGDFYKIQYEKFQNGVNYVFLTSGWEGMSQLIKGSVLEKIPTDTKEPSTSSGFISRNNKKIWTDTYQKCIEFNYTKDKKSCIDD